MKKKIKYTNEKINARVIDDFLPSPEQLVLKDETVKVTLNLTKSSLDFFKQIAAEHHTKYQQLIRRLVDEYATKHSH